MKTDYAGIDYGNGKSNRDTETGIRFGVIAQRSVSPEALEDIIQKGENLSFKQFQQEAKDKLRSALEDYFSDHKWGSDTESKLGRAVSNCWDAIENDINETYQGDEDTIEYEKDGYKIRTSGPDLWVFKSPHFTHAQFCSPCCPGAGNLDNPCDDGPETYCLGPEWFEDKKAPYEEIFPTPTPTTTPTTTPATP